MAKPKKKGGPKQKLSPKAASAKKKRDTAAANSPARKAKRAENQRKRKEAAEKHGKNWLVGKDYDHRRGKFVSVASNRGNKGEGTKKEGKNS